MGKLRGHKFGCHCVGCDPATRKRGMAALKRHPRKRQARKNAGTCPVCSGPGYGAGEICMDCVKARAKGVYARKCICGSKRIPGAIRSVGSRRWIPCERCLQTVKQINPCRRKKRKNPYVHIKYKARRTKLWREKPTGQWGRGPRKAKHNPVGREVTIYARFLPFKIYAVKGASSMYAGERFQHQFKAGGKVTGLPDGSIRLYPAPGKRLWSMIKQR